MFVFLEFVLSRLDIRFKFFSFLSTYILNFTRDERIKLKVEGKDIETKSFFYHFSRSYSSFVHLINVCIRKLYVFEIISSKNYQSTRTK